MRYVIIVNFQFSYNVHKLIYIWALIFTSHWFLKCFLIQFCHERLLYSCQSRALWDILNYYVLEVIDCICGLSFTDLKKVKIKYLGLSTYRHFHTIHFQKYQNTGNILQF